MADRMSDSLYSGNLRPPSSPKNAAARNLQDLLDSNLAAKQMRMGIAPDVRNTTPGLSTWDGALRALRRDATKIGEGIKTGFDNLGTDMRLPWGSPPEAYNAVTNAAMATMGLGYGPAVGKMAMGNLRPNPSQLNMFLGEGARTADKSVLKKAKAMEKKGATRDEIWQATAAAGQPWMKDIKGDWKFEVSDRGMDFKDAGMAKFKKDPVGRYTLVEDMVRHKKMDDAYGISKGQHSIRKGDGWGEGSWDGGDFSLASRPKRQMKKAYLHEGQHYVQQKEKHAGGGDPDMIMEKTPPKKVKARLAKLKREFEALPGGSPERIAKVNEWYKIGDKYSSFGQYKRLLGEADARNTANRMDMTPAQRAKTPPWKTLDVPENEIIFGDDWYN